MMQGVPKPAAVAEAVYSALNAGDLEGFLAHVTEDVEFTSLVAEAEGTTFRGHDGVRAWWETVRGGFHGVRWELLGFRGDEESGLIRMHMSGELGGVPLGQEMWQAVRLREGKACWWGIFRTDQEAAEALAAGGGPPT